MPYCKECGNFVEITGSLCANCQKQAAINASSVAKPYKRARPWTLSRGLKYPRSIIFVIVLAVILNLERFGLDISQWIDLRSFEDLIMLIIPLVIGITAVNKEGGNLIATVGFIILIGSVVFYLWAILMIFGWIFGIYT